MTLHDRALVWVASTLGLKNTTVNHQDFKKRNMLTKPLPMRIAGGAEPDVVEHVDGLPSAIGLHEVQVLDIASKVGHWAKDPRHRTLWIVVPKGTRGAFDRIRMIEETEDGFVERMKGRFLNP